MQAAVVDAVKVLQCKNCLRYKIEGGLYDHLFYCCKPFCNSTNAVF